MDNLEITDQQKKCMACRECCEYVEYPVTMLSAEVIEYFHFRGERMYLNPKNGVLSIRVYKPCQHLGPDGCMIYGARPGTCRVFMCDEKDNTIKAHKEKACDETGAMIEAMIKQYKEKMEAGNDL